MVTFHVRVEQPLPDIEGAVKAITKKILADFIKRFGRAAKTELRGKLAGEIPVKTGRLKGAFRITQIGNKILIGFDSRAFYWRFQKGMRQQHIQTTISWIEKRAPELLRQSIQAST